MRFISGAITFLASLAVIVLSVSWAVERYGFGAGLGIITEESLDDQFHVTGIPIDGDIAPVITDSRLFDEIRWAQQGADRLLLAVGTGDMQRYFGRAFMSTSYNPDGQILQGGSCRRATVNIIEIDPESGAADVLFDRRVFLPSYAYLETDDDDNEYLLALVVTSDTNEDGYLSCKDLAQFHIKRFDGQPDLVLEREFVPENISNINFRWRDGHFEFVERYYRDGNYVFSSITISADGETISKSETPDLLLTAKGAFERNNFE